MNNYERSAFFVNVDYFYIPQYAQNSSHFWTIKASVHMRGSFPAQMVEGANVCELLINPESLNAAAACQSSVCSDVVSCERNQRADPALGDWLIENHLRWIATQSFIEIWMSSMPLWLCLVDVSDGNAKSQRSGRYASCASCELCISLTYYWMCRWVVCLLHALSNQYSIHFHWCKGAQ